MTTSAEMNAIRATFTAQGVQETLPLRAAGYREPSVLSASYPFLPVAHTEMHSAQWLREMTNTNGHCGQ